MDNIHKTVEQLGASDQAEACKAYHTLFLWIHREVGKDPARRAEAARQLAEQYTATVPGGKDDQGNEKPPREKYGREIKRQLLRLMSYVAGAEQVAVIAPALNDLQLREMARYALERIKAPEATEALVSALESSSGPEFRIGLVAALSACGCASAMRALQKTATEDEQQEVAIAAAEGLARFAEPSVDETLASLAGSECPQQRRRIQATRIELARRLAEAGDTAAARRIYQAIRHSDAPDPQKQAAAHCLETLRS